MLQEAQGEDDSDYRNILCSPAQEGPNCFLSDQNGMKSYAKGNSAVDLASGGLVIKHSTEWSQSVRLECHAK